MSIINRTLKISYIKLSRLKENCKNIFLLIFLFPLLKYKRLKALKTHTFFDWHQNTTYFTGKYHSRKVFLKCEVGLKKNLINEHNVYNELNKDPNRKFFLPDLINTFNFLFCYCIIYEFIEGQTLSKYFNDKKNIKADKFFDQMIVDQLIQIIDHLFKARVIHRDLRPKNIFLLDRRLILFDFTFSIWLNDPKQPVFDIRTEKALGEHYKPEELKWDDAYSLKVMLEESPLIISNKSLNEIVNRINRLTH